jgi:hypothetical protein
VAYRKEKKCKRAFGWENLNKKIPHENIHTFEDVIKMNFKEIG